MHKIQDSTIYIAMVALPVIFILTPWIVKIICGAKYAPVILAFRLLLVAVFFINANAFRVQFLLVSGRMDLYSKIHLIVAAAGLPLIFILIHYFSYLGAAFSTIITELGILLLTLNTLEALAFSEK
jgi:O-antigen/teichoic acid export membrane protein